MGLQRSVVTFLLRFLLVNLDPSVMALFVVEKKSLTVASQNSIKGIQDSAIGNFGIPRYGGNMAGMVAYPKENRKGCHGFDKSGISFKSKPSALPTFVLVNRGDTLFVRFDCVVWCSGILGLVGLCHFGEFWMASELGS
ncbi:hypothetical protein F0562_012392 [Nyssa sinensis]|uniref:Uncharacterized protein n=1 Tax=Nyssa sinensis TaxID=561372 RepID=A0A5J4ZUK6_9ASTE|nr:hypothetical protein F0562_012392 [Nyssa sinensis]